MNYSDALREYFRNINWYEKRTAKHVDEKYDMFLKMYNERIGRYV